MRTAKFFLIVTLGAMAALAAQEPAPPFKQVPVPPAFSRWTIEYQVPKKRNGEDADSTEQRHLLAKKEYTVTGDTGLVKEWYADGSMIEIYQSGTWQLLKPRGSKRIVVLDTTDQLSPEQIIGRVYPGVSWVRADRLTDVVQAHGETCLYFKGTQAVEGTEASPAVVQEAWIGQKTGLPVAYRINGVEGRYTFQSPPQEKIQLPAEFVRYLNDKIRPGPPPGQTASLLKE